MMMKVMWRGETYFVGDVSSDIATQLNQGRMKVISSRLSETMEHSIRNI